MSSRLTVPSPTMRVEQSALNGQGLLLIAVAPSGKQNVVGLPLVDAGQLDVLGVYRCLIPLAGAVSKLEVHLTATFGSGTVTSDLDTLYFVRDLNDPTTWSKKTAGSGDGALSTTVLQTSTITDLAGEQWAVLDLTLGTAAACTFTRGEWNCK